MRHTYSQKYVENIFQSRRCLLLSKYVSSKDKLIYLCPNGHRNSIRIDCFKTAKTLCMQCKIYDAWNCFKERGFKLLETRYINTNTKMKYRCPVGHIHSITLRDFKCGDGCPYCAKNKKYNFHYVKDIFNKLNYTLLTQENEYENSKTLLNFICDKGHHEVTDLQRLHVGRKCYTCGGTKKYNYKFIKTEIEKRNHKLLSQKYINSGKKLVIQCPNNHIFNMSWSVFNKGHGCKHCKHKMEQYCREIFEELYGIKFEHKRHEWLNGLELDGYNDDLRMGFEYNGEQHYKHVKYFHKNGRTLEQQQKRDKLKEQLCEYCDVKLFVIPYTVPKEDLYSYIFNLTEIHRRVLCLSYAKEKPVYKQDPKTLKIIKTYESLTKAAEGENITGTTMRRISTNKTLYNGVVYSRSPIKNINEITKLKSKPTKSKTIYKIINGKVIETYSSIRKAAKENNIGSSTLQYRISKEKIINGVLFRKSL